MIKALLKYLLSACILFLSGQGFLHAHTHQHYIHASSIKIPGRPTRTGFGIVQNSVIATISSAGEKENYELKPFVVCDDNDDDDELTSVKKHAGADHGSAPIFLAQTSGHFCIYSKKILPFYKHFSYTGSCRYLVFRAFRV